MRNPKPNDNTGIHSGQKGRKMQRRLPSRYDSITDLPQSIIETILTKLPLRDAVRTSILSSKWRYKWATLTNLVFNDTCIFGTKDKSLSEFISRFLLLHDGPINTFVLTTGYLQRSSDVDQWLLFLSRKDVTELVLELGEASWFRLPSCLFSCQKLIRLELFGWELNPPSSFKGFKFLKHLKFQQVLIRPDALQNLISNCTLLETLDLSYYDNLQLTIRAPNLKNLTLEGDIKDISLEHTPKLLSITVSMYMTDDISQHFSQSQSCSFDKFLGCVPSLQKLTGRSYFTEYMSIGNNTFGKTEIKYQKLKVLELSQVSFDDVKGIRVILRLILNSPNLQQLQIAGSSMGTEVTDLDFWEKECPIDCRFERLKVVKMMDMCGVPHEVRFIGFLLQNSPVLESMSVTPSLYMTNERLSFLIEITRFPRASPQAQMVFVQD